MTSNTRELTRSEVKISQVEEYLNYLQPYQGEKVEPTVSEDSKQCAIAIRKEFQSFEGMRHTVIVYFYERGDYAERVSKSFDNLSEYLYPLVEDMVETRLQGNWALFFQTLISEAFMKSRSAPTESNREEINDYLNRDLSIDGLKKLIDTGNISGESLATDIKAELIYALQYCMSGNLEV